MAEPQIAQLARETRSSIELHRDAKGIYSFTAKVYYEEGAEALALQTLERIDARLRASYLSE